MNNKFINKTLDFQPDDKFTQQGKKILVSYYQSGDICKQFEDCVALHMIAAELVNESTDYCYKFSAIDMHDLEIGPEEYQHILNLADQWQDDLKSELINELGIDDDYPF